MALLFMDSFDHYTLATDLALKWTIAIGGASINTSNGRNGTAALNLGANNQAYQVVPTGDVFIVGFGMKITVIPNDQTYLAFRDNGNVQIDFRVLTNGKLKVTRNGTLLCTSSNVLFAANTYYHLQHKVLIANAGSFEVKVNDVLVTWDDTPSPHTNCDTSATANQTADQVYLVGPSGSNYYYDDLWICDDSGSVNNDYLGDVRVQALVPNGDGSSVQWLPSTGSGQPHWSTVDEIPPNIDSDYVSSATPGNVDLYSFTDLASGAGTVKGLQTVLNARKDDAGTRTIRPKIRNNATTSDGASVNIGTTYDFYTQIFEGNPSNSNAPWTVSDVNSGEFGVELVA